MTATTMLIDFPGHGSYARTWLDDHPDRLQELLTQCRGQYPLCLCRQPGLPLYIARRSKLYLARVPNSGPQHHPQCPSYEPERAFCGWSIYSPRALRESADGQLAIKLAFALNIRGGRPAAAHDSVEATSTDTIRRDALKLSGLLHLLWERSEFNRWRPGMLHRRHYRQLRKYLLETADTIHLQRHTLTRHLYIPEAYDRGLALEIEARRQLTFHQLGQNAKGMPLRILTLARIRSITQTETALALRLAHLPNEFTVAIPPELLARLQQQTQFAWLDGHSIHPEFQLFAFFTMQRSPKHYWQIDEVTGLVTTPEFLPVRSMEEALLCQRLVTEGRSFYKPLSYDAPAGRFPNFILTDGNEGRVVPMEIIPTHAAEGAMRRLRVTNYEASNAPFWTWDAIESATPPPIEPRMKHTES